MKKALSITALFMFLSLVLSACSGGGGSGGGAGKNGAGSGELAVQYSWPVAQPELPAGIDACSFYKITTINASVTDSSGNTVASASWQCSAHGGTVSNVPAGTVSLIISCEEGGVVAWSGQATGINVVAGQTATAGTIAMNYVGNDHEAPTVTKTTPTKDEANAALTATVTAVFSEDVAAPSVNTNTFSLTCNATPVSASTVSYDPTTFMATLTLTSPLPALSSCSATITNDVEDLAGNQLATYQWNFNTSAAPLTTGMWDVSQWDKALWGP